MMKEVHSRVQQLGKRRKSRKSKRSSSRIQEENECKHKMIGEVRYSKKRNFRRGELLGKYIIKMLYEQDNKKFENKYLKKLEKLAKIEASFSGGEILKGR